MSFNYKIACASSVSQVCEANRSNFIFDGKSMKKENHGTASPLAAAVNSDSEQCVGVFDGVTSPEAAHVAINCLRYYLKQRQADDTDYIKQLQDYYTASDRVIAGLDVEGDKRVSCAVGFIRYNGFYFASAGDCLVYLWRNGDLTLLNTPENEARPLGGNGAFAIEPIYGEIFTGDRIVMCTTSLKKSMSNDRFRSIISDSASVDEVADALCNEAMTRGITDCASVCVVEIGEQTSEGYWILPGLIYTPEVETPVPYFEGDTKTIEISSGSAVTNDVETPVVQEEPTSSDEIILPPPITLPEPELGSPVVDKIIQEEPKKPTAGELHRAAEEKKKRIIVISCVIAGVLLLGFILTFIIIGTASNHGGKSDDTTPLVTTPADTEAEEPEDTDEDEDIEDTEDTEDTTTEDTSTEDTSTEESTEDSEETSEDSTSTDETEEPEPEDNTTSRGYTIEYRDGAHYVQVGNNEILVANKSYELSSSYNPGGLTSATKSAFNNLVDAAADEGYTITNESGFRSYATQQRVYSGWVNTYGQEQADRISARPGHSEHQTGMAIDVNSLDESFGETEEGKWLAKNAHKYGFIIRYPEGKEGVTGYAYEPWHIRYVGEIAEDIYNSGLTLEEYLGIDSQYTEE